MENDKWLDYFALAGACQEKYLNFNELILRILPHILDDYRAQKEAVPSPRPLDHTPRVGARNAQRPPWGRIGFFVRLLCRGSASKIENAAPPTNSRRCMPAQEYCPRMFVFSQMNVRGKCLVLLSRKDRVSPERTCVDRMEPA